MKVCTMCGQPLAEHAPQATTTPVKVVQVAAQTLCSVRRPKRKAPRRQTAKSPVAHAEQAKKPLQPQTKSQQIFNRKPGRTVFPVEQLDKAAEPADQPAENQPGLSSKDNPRADAVASARAAVPVDKPREMTPVPEPQSEHTANRQTGPQLWPDLQVDQMTVEDGANEPVVLPELPEHLREAYASKPLHLKELVEVINQLVPH